MPRLLVEWTPDGRVMADEYAVYYRQTDDPDWIEAGSTRGSSLEVEIAGKGLYEFGVAAIVQGVEAVPEDWSTFTYRITETADLTGPTTVTNFSAAQDGRYVAFRWDENTSPNIKEFEIRRGADWDSALKIATQAARRTYLRVGWMASGTQTYQIRARSEDGQLGGAATTSIAIQGDSYFPITGTSDEAAGGFLGTKTGTEVSGGDLIIKEAPATASAWSATANTYDWPPAFPHEGSGTYVTDWTDLGAVKDVVPEIDVGSSINSGTTPFADDWTFIVDPDEDASGNAINIDAETGTLHEVYGDGDLVAGPDVKVEIDTAQDAVPTPDGFRIWIPGAAYRCRQYRVRLTLTSPWFTNLSVSTFAVKRRQQNRKDDQTVTISGTGGTTVTWATVFSAAPMVAATYIGSNSYFASVHTISSDTAIVQLWDDSGTEQAAGTVHVHALGV